MDVHTYTYGLDILLHNELSIHSELTERCHTEMMPKILVGTSLQFFLPYRIKDKIK